MTLPVYLDHNATTPNDPEVAEEMRPFLTGIFGNPSSSYSYGAHARTVVEIARSRAARLLGCRSHEVIFTSGGTEANNLAIKGVASAYAERGNHIITTCIEHPAVTEVCDYLERRGYRITRLGVDGHGRVDPDDLKRAMTGNTILVSIMHANNEIGTIQPIRELSALCRERGVIFHTDAAQTAGKVRVDDLGVDLISVAGHKLYGPKGVGALYFREGIRLEKLLHGADHEQDLRAGTENVMSIAGFGKACEVALRDLEGNNRKMRASRDLMEEMFEGWGNNFWLTGQSKSDKGFDVNSRFFWLTGQSKIDEDRISNQNHFWLTGQSKNTPAPPLRFNGHPTLRLPNTLNLSFRGIDASLLLPAIANQVAASAGAACHASEITISPTLKAIGLPDDYAAGTLRLSTGKHTSREEVEFAVETILNAVGKMMTPEKGSSIIRRDRDENLKITENSDASISDNDNPSVTPPVIDSLKPETDASSYPLSEEGTDRIRLTQFTQGMGCACKLKPQLLKKVLADLPQLSNPNVLVGPETFDDAAVYTLNPETAIVQTVDFFTPVVDDPYDFGRIAAANSLSDIYAMGATPLFALNIAGFPSTRLPYEVLQRILQGAADKAAEAGIPILGGHTIDDLEPKFGMAVTGMLHPDKILKNSTARPGDVLILTKPIGTGILATALKRGLLDGETSKILAETMATLNKKAADIMAGYPVSACTDVTGFGLLGHLSEMTSHSQVEAEVYASEIPLLPRVESLAAAGIVPGGSLANLDYISDKITWGDDISAIRKVILCDAQTSGGLLIAVPENYAVKLAEETGAAAIGRITSIGSGGISVVSRQ